MLGYYKIEKGKLRKKRKKREKKGFRVRIRGVD